jgi:DNA topoisomerase-1
MNANKTQNKLVIVESPAKAKTIEKYLGDGYTVRASIGHVRDLPKTNKDAVDIEAGFVPKYVISPEKRHVIDDLKKLAEKSDEVILATDLDREGEAIAWHLKEALGLKNPKRIVFNEITKDAIQEAIQNPRHVDMKLKEAQEARRVLDRLFGYDLSGLIWKKVRYGLSAGRVQSPALRILMEREREIRAFIPETYFVLSGLFTEHNKNTTPFTLTCDKEIWDEKEALDIVARGEKGTWSIVSIKETEAKRNANAPFTTSTLQQTASTRLGFSPSRTMRTAQKLYEAGFITYMRTDSKNLSKQAQSAILAHVEKEYGKEYVKFQTYEATGKHAQEAHEAIRPTSVSKEHAGITDDEKSLYNLIWRRAVASQMAPAQMLKTKLSANITDNSIPNFSVNGQRTLFPGWLAVDSDARGDDTEVPKLKEGDVIDLKDLQKLEKQTQPPNRYSEAGLIKELESRGIGRPSTYASIIQTIVERGYVEKIARTLKPTDIGDVVSTFIETHFGGYISDDFTSDMESKLDGIAEGSREYVKTLSEFWKPFHSDVLGKENIEKLTNLGDAPKEFKCPKCGSGMVYKLGRTGKFMSCDKFPDCDGALTNEGKELGKNTPLGVDPKTGLNIYVLDGRFGPYVQLGETPEKVKKEKKKKAPKKSKKDSPKTDALAEPVIEKKEVPNPRRASLPVGMKTEDVTMDTALHLLILPRELGMHPEKQEVVIANIGRFGPYIGVGREFRSLTKSSGFDPYTITLKDAVELLNKPKNLPKGVEKVRVIGIHPKTKKEIELFKSKSGYFMKKGLKRIFLDSKIDPEKITIEEVVEMMK